MDQEKLEAFDKVREAEDQLYKNIGSIVLTPDANIRDYVLATISVLNRMQDGPVRNQVLEFAIQGVDNYDLWETDCNGERIIKYRDPKEMRKDLFVNYRDLQSIGLIEQSTDGAILTDLGKHALGSVIPPENIKGEETPLSNARVMRIASFSSRTIVRNGKRITTTTSEIPDEETLKNVEWMLAKLRGNSKED
jgi:hypothetical protein